MKRSNRSKFGAILLYYEILSAACSLSFLVLFNSQEKLAYRLLVGALSFGESPLGLDNVIF